LTDPPTQHAESADGTRIAYRRFRSGRPIVVVGARSAAMPGTDLVVVPESHDHRVDSAGAVREVRARID
jgi:hypothetical protein